MLRPALALLLLVSLAASGVPRVAGAERVRLDGIAAIVGGTAPREDTITILHGDVDLEAYLTRARAGSNDLASPSDAERDAARERLIGRALLVHEARRLRLDSLDDERKSTEWRRFFERHGGAATVERIAERLRLRDDELEKYVDAEAIARNFVFASSEQGGIVTESELETAWEQGNHPFVGMDLETMREPMRAFLLERRLDEESAHWIERLRARVVIRRNRRG